MSVRVFEDGSIEARPDVPTEHVYVSLIAMVGPRTYTHQRHYDAPVGATDVVLGNLLATAVAKVIDQSKGVST